MSRIRGLPIAASLFCVTVAWSILAHGEQPAIVVHETDEDFEWVKSNVHDAITERGLVISGELHLSDMLERTGEDLGFAEPVYARAESIEFCSALMSHRMAAIDPRNLVVCPFTVAIYSTAAEPEKVYVAFSRPVLQGEGKEVEAAILEMLDGIARQATE